MRKVFFTAFPVQAYNNKFEIKMQFIYKNNIYFNVIVILLPFCLSHLSFTISWSGFDFLKVFVTNPK